jgi:hypothetical protein
MDFKNIDINGLIKKYTSPQAVKDFDTFLDDLPANLGTNILIAAGVVWLFAGALIFFVSQEAGKLSEMRNELVKVEALQPPVPVLSTIAVDKASLDVFAETLSDLYKGIIIKVGSGGEVSITAQDTDYFPQFLATISYFQSGGKNWRISMKDMCVGKDCIPSKLKATLKIEVVKINDPKTGENRKKTG